MRLGLLAYFAAIALSSHAFSEPTPGEVRRILSQQAIAQSVLNARWKVLLDLSISFRPGEEFTAEDADNRFRICRDELILSAFGKLPRETTGRQAEVSGLYDTELLTAGEEQALFARMNYLKFWAVTRIEAARVDVKLRTARGAAVIENELAEAENIRNHAIVANTLLVKSLVNRYASDLPEALSEGLEELFRAIEKFEYQRGFRFSSFYGRIFTQEMQRKRRRYYKQKEHEEGVEDVEIYDDGVEETPVDMEMDRREAIERLIVVLDTLDDRERVILQWAYGIDGVTKTRKEIAAILNITDERVRQIQNRAQLKLLKALQRKSPK